MRRTLMALVLVAGLVLAACGDDDSASDESTTTTTEATEDDDERDEPGSKTGDDEEGAEIELEDGTDLFAIDDDASLEELLASGLDDDCLFLAEFIRSFISGEIFLNQDAVLSDDFEEAVERAPAEVRDAMRELADFFARLRQNPETAAEALGDPALTEAGTDIQDYIDENCPDQASP